VLKPDHETYIKEDIELIPREDAARPGWRFWTINGPVETDKLGFLVGEQTPDKDVYVRLKKGEAYDLTFNHPFDSTQSLSLTYHFTGGKPAFSVTASGHNTQTLWVRDYVEVYWNGGLRYTEPDTAQDQTYSEAFLYFTGNTLETLKINTKKDEVAEPTSGNTLWGAIRTKYFLTALVPDSIIATAGQMESRLDSTYAGAFHPNRLGVKIRLPLKPDGTNSVRMYLGPLDDGIIKSVEPSLTETMSWGWIIFKPFSIGILWLLKWVHKFVPNYGVCIIIFSILIKLVIWPLTRKSYQSMAAMQRLKPVLDEMKIKYKGDAQRLQQEQMKLYKREKINPFGGCLPIVLQMPLLIALFNVFRATIEFRQAPFVFWIKDLSMPDVLFNLPFHIPLYGAHIAFLPILMGISTFYQSKSTMTDPNQKTMLYIMPIIMVLMFNNFPSGLTFYYTLFNVFTLLQQKITPIPQVSSTPEPQPKKR